MEEFGIIKECNEPSLFCSNLLVTKKKDGKNIRILLDGRLINSYTRRLPTNLVTHSELYAHLVGKTHVTTIDLSDAFFQIPLSKESQPLTAFYSLCHGKRYCFQRVPQGLRNSPLHLKLLMDELFGDMANDVIHYVDDIMLATNGSLKDHLQKLSLILEKLEKADLKIRPSKLNIARKTINFLDSIVQESKECPPMSESQTIQLLDKLKIPSGYNFTQAEVAHMLEAESLPNPNLKKARKSSSKLGERIIQNLPTTLHKRVIKMPKQVAYAPGALLPAHCNNLQATSISYSD